jgi:hypothetical protein
MTPTALFLSCVFYDSYILTACGLTCHTWIIYITTNTQSHFVQRQKLPRCVNSHHTIQTNTWHRPQAPRRVGGDGALRGTGPRRGRSGAGGPDRARSGPAGPRDFFDIIWLIDFFLHNLRQFGLIGPKTRFFLASPPRLVQSWMIHIITCPKGDYARRGTRNANYLPQRCTMPIKYVAFCQGVDTVWSLIWSIWYASIGLIQYNIQ